MTGDTQCGGGIWAAQSWHCSVEPGVEAGEVVKPQLSLELVLGVPTLSPLRTHLKDTHTHTPPFLGQKELNITETKEGQPLLKEVFFP